MRRRGATTRTPAEHGDVITVDMTEMRNGKVWINGIPFTKPVFCTNAFQTAINCSSGGGMLGDVTNPKGTSGVSFKFEERKLTRAEILRNDVFGI